MRHDITYPLYVQVDEIYNFACPASLVYYQFDPVQMTHPARRLRSEPPSELLYRRNKKAHFPPMDYIFVEPAVASLAYCIQPPFFGGGVAFQRRTGRGIENHD